MTFRNTLIFSRRGVVSLSSQRTTHCLQLSSTATLHTWRPSPPFATCGGYTEGCHGTREAGMKKGTRLEQTDRNEKKKKKESGPYDVILDT
jgi:hypothetical protein